MFKAEYTVKASQPKWMIASFQAQAHLRHQRLGMIAIRSLIDGRARTCFSMPPIPSICRKSRWVIAGSWNTPADFLL